MLSDEDRIDVLTTIPNRYRSYRTEYKEEESDGNLHIRRIAIPAHRNNFSGQIMSFRRYYKNVLSEIRGKSYDLVFASSSRLFTAFLGARAAGVVNAPLYLDIRDIFTETMNEVIVNRLLRFSVIPVLGKIESYTFRRASHINLVSEGFAAHFEKFRQASLTFYTNGIDEEFLADRAGEPSLNSFHIITYAGNIGEGQGLEKIIPAAAARLFNYRFRIIGDGGTRKNLESEIRRLGLKNVEVILPVSRARLVEYYRESDYFFIHLNDYKAFEKVLPSKLFEYAAYNKPIIAGLSGYPKYFVENNVENHILFTPGNAEDMVRKLNEYSYRTHRRTGFIEKYSRNAIIAEMAASVIACGTKRGKK
jgi:glycosyltransferase involved in cell wall biosynthesis